MKQLWALGLAAVLPLAACGSAGGTEASAGNATETTTTLEAAATTQSVGSDGETASTVEDADVAETADTSTARPSGNSSIYRVDVWADNWMAVYVDGELVGEDSVPITTERSFNAESFEFEAATPFTVAIEAKDFTETDSGLEYIGTDRQQMGDGGLIAQVTDLATGEVVSVTDSSWATLVVHRAPLNTDCEQDPDPDTTCQSEITQAPDGWTAAGFDDSGWTVATEWSADAVSPKDGYDEIDWSTSAVLVWGADLDVDNTVLLRTVVGG